MATSEVGTSNMSCAVTGYLIDRYSRIGGVPGDVSRATVMRLFLSTPAAATETVVAAGSSPGGLAPSSALIYFSDQGSLSLVGEDAQIGTLEAEDPGSVGITAVLPSGEFDLWWEILRHAQPAALSCIAVTPRARPPGPGKVMELHLIGGIGAALPPPGLGIVGRLT
jgi:hypothetical protein